MAFAIRAAAVAAILPAMAAGAPAAWAAEYVIQQQSFTLSDSYLIGNTEIYNGNRQAGPINFSASSQDSMMLGFNGADSTLGVLTSVEVYFSSEQTLRGEVVGAAPTGSGAFFEINPSYRIELALGDDVIGVNQRSFRGKYDVGIRCDVGSDQACQGSNSLSEIFELETVLEPTAAFQAEQVYFDLSHVLGFTGEGLGVGAPPPSFAARSDFDWAGQMMLVYVYEPTAVPEPAAWAMMIVGFGAIGAAQRRRRRMAVITAAI